MMYMPIWILYIFPFILPVNFISKFILTAIAYWLSFKILRMPKVRKAKRIWISWTFAMVAEFIGLFIFYITEMNIEWRTYSEIYTPIATGIFTFEFIVYFLFNYFFAMRKQTDKKSQRAITAAIITVLSAPYLFLLPQ